MTRPPIHPKVRIFLHERDRALARGDGGVVRSIDAELRRLGVSDDATLANPTGKSSRAVRVPGASKTAVAEPKAKNVPRLPRCEHENVEERCDICHPELAAR